MGRIIVIFILVVSLLSCNSKKSETNTLQYNLLGSFDNKFEIGYNEEKQCAYLSDIENNIVIVFICEKPDYKYSLEDFKDTTNNWGNNGSNLNEYALESLRSTVLWCKNNSDKEEEIIEKNSKLNKKLYYITYRKAYGMFHI